MDLSEFYRQLDRQIMEKKEREKSRPSGERRHHNEDVQQERRSGEDRRNKLRSK